MEVQVYLDVADILVVDLEEVCDFFCFVKFMVLV